MPPRQKTPLPPARRVPSRFLRLLLISSVAGGVVFFIFGIWAHSHYSKIIDERLAAGPVPNTSMIFAAPRTIAVGDPMTQQDIIGSLQNSGYGASKSNRMGWYNQRADAIDIMPGPDSYFDNEGGVVRVADGKVSSIISLRDNTARKEYSLEPELVTNLFDSKREKRRVIAFKDIPRRLVNAVISVEDKRFFQHAGFDPIRIAKALYVDIRERRAAEGASTLSMQLARTFWLTQDKTWKRKVEEMIITAIVEQKLSKEEIFEYYANNVDMGQRGSFNIRGLGEASQAYFGKDVRALTLPEAATIAGTIQRPNYTNPLRRPERAKSRRNVVLALMRDNGYISDKEYAEAAASPMVVVRGGGESLDAPYFVDLVNDTLQDQFQDYDFENRNYRIYTTLDLDLQRDAVEAVRIGMQEVDKQIQRRKIKDPGPAQVAMVVLDPQTGEIRALIGGRNYGTSQLNRAVAKRQPGSSFKPFVYAAALNTAVNGSTNVFTPASMVVDEPTTFWYNGNPYEPHNHEDKYYGPVTLRFALAKSLNIPAVKLAEAVGFGQVVSLARASGMNLQIRPTPSLALGAYEVTPIEVAGGYTVFANNGAYVKPSWIKAIRDSEGAVIHENKPVRKQVLDARIAYIVTDMMQEVLRSGTGAGVHSYGFNLTAAGKTGTSHDGWFAGFTSKLICAVWVGFDDNAELRLEGAHSALPIWAEFMKRAHTHRAYRNPAPFSAPEGVVSVEIDPSSGLLASAGAANPKMEVFVTGTQPVNVSAGGTQVASWDAPDGEQRRDAPREPGAMRTRNGQPRQEPAEEKHGLFGRIGDWFKKRNP